MSRKEIARRLGISEIQVKSELKRAMKKLRDGRAEKCRDLMIAKETERRASDSLKSRIAALCQSPVAGRLGDAD